MAESMDRKRFYGTITVSERGQIVIPAEARRDFNIETGDKLLVLGDLDRGLAIMKGSMVLEKIPGLMDVLETGRETSKGDGA